MESATIPTPPSTGLSGSGILLSILEDQNAKKYQHYIYA